ncbi:MAG: SPOR domain-containing protein [Gammaproteobacteria bacterium]|nr:SPOR domain-containing protein [Gammaproteobacteria bacterium]
MKERLTGAIILVALIVLLVPELLTGPIRMKSAPVAGSVRPAQPPLRSYTLTLGGASPAAPVQAQPARNAARSPTESPTAGPGSPAESPKEGDQPQHAPTPQDSASNASSPSLSQGSAGADSDLQAAKSPAHPSIREARSSASSSTGWVVQLGSFASRQNADRLAHALAGRGFRMSVSPARAGSRELWRVRAGPAHDRAGAQRLAARLRALGHRGELLPVR